MLAKVIKIKLMNKNKRHIGLKISSVKTRTAHSRDRCTQAKRTTEQQRNGKGIREETLRTFYTFGFCQHTKYRPQKTKRVKFTDPLNKI